MLMNAYCEQNDLKVKQCCFIFKTSIISGDETPDSHEMVSGDQIKVAFKKKKPEVPTSQKPKDPIKKKSPSSQSPRPKSNDENGTFPSPQNPSKRNITPPKPFIPSNSQFGSFVEEHLNKDEDQFELMLIEKWKQGEFTM